MHAFPVFCSIFSAQSSYLACWTLTINRERFFSTRKLSSKKNSRGKYSKHYSSRVLYILQTSCMVAVFIIFSIKSNFIEYFLVCFKKSSTFEHLPWLYNPHKTIRIKQFPRSYVRIMQPILQILTIFIRKSASPLLYHFHSHYCKQAPIVR